MGDIQRKSQKKDVRVVLISFHLYTSSCILLNKCAVKTVPNMRLATSEANAARSASITTRATATMAKQMNKGILCLF